MGNTLHHRVPVEPTVRVYHGDNGELLQFTKSISAATLMRQHPNYLLVHSVVQVRQTISAHRSRVLRRTVHIRLVRPGDYLHIGHDYFLVHIPDQYRPRFARYFDLLRSDLSAGSASPLSRSGSRYHTSPSASPLYSPTASPLYSPTASPLYSHMASPHRSFWSSTASPLGASLQMSSLSDSARDRTRVATPQPAYIRTPLSGSTQEITRVATPRSIHIPARRFNGSSRETTRVPTPLSSHIPIRLNGSSLGTTRVATPLPIQNLIQSPLRGSTLETTRVVNQMHTQLNAAHSNRIQSPAGSGTSRQHITLGSIISSSQNSIADYKNTNRYSKGSVNSPGRVMQPAAPQDTMRNVLHPNCSQVHRNSPNRLVRSPGNSAIGASPTTPKGNFNQRLKGSSHAKSPRRSSKSGSGKFNFRQRRSGTRSHSYSKASVPSKSPGREVVSAPFLRRLDSEESRTTTKSGAAGPAAKPVPVAGGEIHSSSGVNAPISRPTKRTFRARFWAPGLGSISENSISDASDIEELSARQCSVLKPLTRSFSFRRAT